MTEKETPNDIKQSLIANATAACRTILQTQCRWALLSLLVLSMASCGPGGTTIHNQYITSQGSDKKLPDDDGYTGGGGTGDGGGGQGISCLSETKNPDFKSKLFVRDIFEGIYNSKLKMKSVPGPSGEGSVEISPESIRFLIDILRGYFGPSLQQLEIGQEKFWLEFAAKISFLDEDAKLHPSQDANSPIALPNGCKIVQIAFWDDSAGRSNNGILYVDKSQWRKLDSLNKIALLAHEYFFKEARRAGYKNSDFVRFRLGQLFSESSNHSLTPAPASVVHYCKGTSEADPNAVIHLFHLWSRSKEFIVIPLIRSSAIGISSLQGKSFEVNGKKVSQSLDVIMQSPPKVPIRHELGNFVGPETWSGYIPSVPSNIKVSLKNPYVLIASEKKATSRDQVPERIFQKIESSITEFTNRNQMESGQSIELQELYQAYIVLNKEIDAYIRDGVYPSAFPKWTAELERMRKKVYSVKWRINAGIMGEPTEAPIQLYKFKAGLLSEAEIESLLRSHEIYSEDTYKIRGTITVSSGSHATDFDITCYDEHTVAVAIDKNNILNGPPLRVGSDEILNIPYKIDFDKFAEAHEQADENDLRSKINLILNNVLRSYRIKNGEVTDGSPQTCDLSTIDGCTVEQRLGYKLERAKTVNIHRCFDYSHSLDARFEVLENYESFAKRCLIVEIPEEKTNYLVTQEGEKSQELNRYVFKTEVKAIGELEYLYSEKKNDPGP